MGTPKSVIEAQVARRKAGERSWGYHLRRSGWEPLPIPADKPVRTLSREEIEAYQREFEARPPKHTRGPR